MPFLGKNSGFSIKNKERIGKSNKTWKKTNKTNKEGLGPSEVAIRATSPNSKTNKQKTKKWKKKKNNNKGNQKQENPNILKNELFSYQSKFCFLGGCPKFPFLDNLAQKARTPKTQSK